MCASAFHPEVQNRGARDRQRRQLTDELGFFCLFFLYINVCQSEIAEAGDSVCFAAFWSTEGNREY